MQYKRILKIPSEFSDKKFLSTVSNNKQKGNLAVEKNGNNNHCKFVLRFHGESYLAAGINYHTLNKPPMTEFFAHSSEVGVSTKQKVQQIV